MIERWMRIRGVRWWKEGALEMGWLRICEETKTHFIARIPRVCEVVVSKELLSAPEMRRLEVTQATLEHGGEEPR